MSERDVRELLAKLTAQEENSGPVVHKFWDTQPVTRLDDTEVDGLEVGHAIEPDVPVEEVRAEPYPLLDAFEWVECDTDMEKDMNDLYTLLSENYVEDGDAFFRFDYSRDFLRWALRPPGWRQDWHVGVRVKATGKLVGFISAIPATVHVREKRMAMVEINFLCVHKKLRTKRLAPVLIKEITRRVNRTGIFQALYTAGVVLPRPVVQCRYWHRSLNPKKLIAVGFSRLAPRMTMKATIKLFQLPPEPLTPGFREMKAEDCEAAQKLVNEYQGRFALRPEFSAKEFEHWFMPLDGVVYSYVVEDPESKQITDFCSFYSLPSSVIRHDAYKTLNAAYSFYNVATKAALSDLVKDALIVAKKNGFDVFNALDLMENESLLKDLKFHIGDGLLNYYIYNWKTRPIKSSENGLVML